MLSACTDEDLYDGKLPLMADVQFNYQWTDTIDYSRPDSMIILGERIVNARRAGKEVSTAGDSAKWYAGVWKMLTFNRDAKVFDYTQIDKGIADENSRRWDFNNFAIGYRSYKATDAEISQTLNNWTDNNDYADYVLTPTTPVVSDTVELFDLKQGETNQVTFTPSPVTQNITLRFNLRKTTKAEDDVALTPFRVDSVKIDLGGVPSTINLYDGLMDVRKTYKLAAKMDFVNGADSFSNDSLALSTSFDVTGIAWPQSATETTGAGILQVVLYVTTDNYGKLSNQRIEGKINLYNTLRRARLLEYTYDGNHARQTTKKGVIDIYDTVVIDGAKIIGNNYGIDQWKNIDDKQIDSE